MKKLFKGGFWLLLGVTFSWTFLSTAEAAEKKIQFEQCWVAPKGQTLTIDWGGPFGITYTKHTMRGKVHIFHVQYERPGQYKKTITVWGNDSGAEESPKWRISAGNSAVFIYRVDPAEQGQIKVCPTKSIGENAAAAAK